MEIKKYLSGAVLLVLVSSVCATGEEASFVTKTKDFCGKNKAAVIATATGLGTTTVAAVLGGLVYRDGKNNTVVGKRDFKTVSEEVRKAEENIVDAQARIEAINNVELKKDGLDKAAIAELKTELNVLDQKIEIFVARLVLDAQLKALDAPAVPADAPAAE